MMAIQGSNTTVSHTPLWRDARADFRARRTNSKNRAALARQVSRPLTSNERAEWEAILGRHADHETEQLRSVLDLIGLNRS